MTIYYMALKFSKKISSEGARRVINIPRKFYDKLLVGKEMMVSEIDYANMSKEELKELIESK